MKNSFSRLTGLTVNTITDRAFCIEKRFKKFGRKNRKKKTVL